MIEVRFRAQEGDSASADGGATVLHGPALDERGQAVLDALRPNCKMMEVTYDVEQMVLHVGGEARGADVADELFQGLDKGRVVLEATTLGFAELFSIIGCFVRAKVPGLEIIYVEPRSYSRVHPGGDLFALSEPTRGYQPIPHSIVDLGADELEAGVFFLGFEPERLDRALEEHQMISSKEIKLVFGIPAFQPGWELDSVVPHLPRLEQGAAMEIAYCAANDPEAAFERLETTRRALGHGNRMFVAPIGTKPCGIAAAIFASVYPEQVGLLFDHPRRRAKRSTGASRWHCYRIEFTYPAPNSDQRCS